MNPIYLVIDHMFFPALAGSLGRLFQPDNQTGLMPDNLLKDLSDQQVLNLIRYLASPRQVGLSARDGNSSPVGVQK